MLAVPHSAVNECFIAVSLKTVKEKHCRTVVIVCFLFSLAHSFFTALTSATSAFKLRFTFFQEHELDLENVASPPVQLPGTLFHPTFTTLLTPVHSENDSRVYFLIVLITDYCWRPWTCRIAAPCKSRVD